MDVRKVIGDNTKRARLRRSLTREQLAELMGLDRAYISGLEQGRRDPGVPAPDRARKYVQAIRAAEKKGPAAMAEALQGPGQKGQTSFAVLSQTVKTKSRSGALGH